jgi:hypothetical protein
LTFVGVDGRKTSETAQCGPWTDTHDGRRERQLVFGAGRLAVSQTMIPAPLGREQPWIYDAVDNEVRCGIHLVRRFRQAYPVELLRLYGYNLDVDPPFILHEPPRGRPVAAQRGRLFLPAQESFGISLFRGVALLADAEIVHGAIAPDTVRWDGRAVHVCGFGHAVLAGEPWQRREISPFTGPERQRGTGPAAHTDDLWAAGVLIYHIATGRPLPAPGQAPGLAGLVVSLTAALGAILDPDPDRRPSAREVLTRLRVPMEPPTGGEPLNAACLEGRRLFDAERARKAATVRASGAPAASAPAGSAPPAPHPPPPWQGPRTAPAPPRRRG